MPHYSQVGDIPARRQTQDQQTAPMAVMIDAFRPLDLGPGARDSEDDGYAWTWLEGR